MISNKDKTWNHLVFLLNLHFLSSSTFFTAYFMIKQNSCLVLSFWFQWVLSLHCSLCSYVSFIRLSLLKKKVLFHTYLSAQIWLSPIFPVSALGNGKLYYYLGFSSTVTTSFKILLDINDHSFSWIPTAYCPNLYSAHQSAFYYN